MTTDTPRIAILGSGPTGLEAALAASRSGYRFTVYERSPNVAGRIREWGHIRLFTPWDLSVSPGIRTALEAAGYTVPKGDDCPTGAELVSQVLEALGSLPDLSPHIRCGVQVVSVGRRGLLKHEEIATRQRADRPFRLLVRDSSGTEWIDEADIVIDCTGNSVPNALGDGGIPALGEAAAEGSISYEVPDVTHEADRWAGRTILVVGGGHSASTAVTRLAALAESRVDTHIVWALRSDVPHPEEGDPLPGRAQLLRQAAELAANPPVCLTVRTGVVVDAIAPTASPEGTTPSGAPRIRVDLNAHDDSRSSVEVDHIVSLVGRVGDHMLYRQLQVHECWATQGPMKLAAALLAQSGSSGDCLDQVSHGPESLLNPEPGLFILGLKSYGRRSDYLMRVGWQQVDEMFGLL